MRLPSSHQPNLRERECWQVYVKGYFDDEGCRYVAPKDNPDTIVVFSVGMEDCGVRRGRQVGTMGGAESFRFPSLSFPCHLTSVTSPKSGH